MIKFTKATEGDIATLNTLINSAYRGDTAKKGWTHEADLLGGIRTSEAMLMETISQQDGAYHLCYEEDELCACIYLKPREKDLYLGTLTVSPDLQNKGYGKVLLSYAEQHALSLHLDAITMTVISVRHELIAWYERHGYRDTGERQPFPMKDTNFGLPNQNLEFVVMQKHLY